MTDYTGSLPTSNSYSVFGSIHIHKFLFGLSLFALIISFPCVPVWYFYLHGFSFDLLLLNFNYILIPACFILILLANRRQIPHLYLPVFIFMLCALAYETYILFDAYSEIMKEIVAFRVTVKQSPKPVFSHEAALAAVNYFSKSFIVHLTFLSIPTIIYLINLLLTDFFFMLEVQGMPIIPFL